MSTKWQRGESNLEGIVILLVIIMVIIISPKNDPSDSYQGHDPEATISSSGSFEILLSTGNASYSYQPYEEYVTIENLGRAAVNITGWQLKNGKDERIYYLGGQLQRFSADVAVIPQASVFLLPSGNSFLQDIILSSGERAVVTTGSIGVRSPYNITSFKENKCTGYIDVLPEYTFTPSLSRNCPRPEFEPGIEGLDTQCRTFIRRLNSCGTPVFEAKDRNGEPCDTCIKNERLSSPCAAFIKEHFSYRGCIAYHAGDQNFSGKTWRIFLDRKWEMWAKDYETIELFDRFGQLMSFRNY
ncbi:MAG: hypothetical protein HYT69_02505 [Candidatus Zambryskibacteria bacterium]|nr:hypothetical protein [Candidatus Zambryskibacteria bacterium]